VFNLGFGEIVVVLVVALIFVGPKMLPELATGLGKIIREIRKATADIRQDIELDDIIRKPLQELRDAATLAPEELKRRDEAKKAQRKAEEEEARRKQSEAEKQAQKQAEKQKEEQKEKQEAQQAEENRRKQREAEEAKANQAPAAQEQKEAQIAKVAPAPVAKPTGPADVITAGGTMVLNPPPAGDIEFLTPLPEMLSPAPIVTGPPPRLPPPPPPRPTPFSVKAAQAPADATVVDLPVQIKASAGTTLPAGSPAAPNAKSPQPGRLPPGRPAPKKG
jgi:TatA/E family protein of Tat protein translocase